MEFDDCQLSQGAIMARVALIAVISALAATAAQALFVDEINSVVSGAVAGGVGGNAYLRLSRRTKSRPDRGPDAD